MAEHVVNSTMPQAKRSGYDPAIHHRRSIRLRGHDYAGGGSYFLTLCVKRGSVGAKNISPLRFGAVINDRMALGVTKYLGGESPWQRDYYDIIIHDDRALDNIRAYIRNNPANWDVLRYGEPRFFAGNRGVLDLPLTAFLASRTGESMGEGFFAPAKWPAPPACVISGFLSPMERAVFDACLADGTPMVWILARGLERGMPNARVRRAVDSGRLLIMTPFDAAVTGYSAGRAAWCNQYVLHMAASAVIGQLTPDGMLSCLLADLRRDIPVHYLCAQSAGAVMLKTVGNMRISSS